MSHAFLLNLAATTDVTRTLLLIGILIAVVVIASVGLMALRRRILNADAGDGIGGVLPLHELRAMKSRGEISEEEFQRLREQVVTAARATPVSEPRSPKTPQGAEKPAGVARPGFDLTGDPLPGASPAADDGGQREQGDSSEAGPGSGSGSDPGGPPEAG